jgi:hypothetical protein
VPKLFFPHENGKIKYTKLENGNKHKKGSKK